jgi:hypothetical protein
MVTCPEDKKHLVELMLVPDEFTARLDELQLQPFDSAMILRDRYSVKLSNFRAMSIAPRPHLVRRPRSPPS